MRVLNQQFNFILRKENIMETSINKLKQIFFMKALSLTALNKTVFIEIISSLLIILFVYAALSKLIDYDTFKFQLGRSPYIMDFAGVITWLIPLVEIVISALLLFKSTRLLGLYSSLALMILFTGYIIAMMNFSSFVPCSCGGVLSMMTWNQHLIFNIAYTILALLGLLLYFQQNKTQSKT
jgi:hypothetical protein